MNLEIDFKENKAPMISSKKKKPTNKRLIEIMKTIQDFKPEFTKESETLKR